jgi:signal transduction histidine kinase
MVDDEVELTKNYRDIAERFFKDVDIANSGEEAIEMFKIGKYDIIYTDLNMPEINGVELIRTIKKIDEEQKFIVISASNESDKLIDLLSLNISGFILKPFNLKNFVSISMEQISILLQFRLMQKETTQLNDKLLQVTKEKQDQEMMLIQQSKLAQTGEMISMIAHQWRQPLSSITTVIAGLKIRLDLGIYEEKENPLDAVKSDLYKTFSKIENSAEFLSKTINDFRNFYRPDNKKILFNLYDALESVLRMLSLNNDNDINIEFDSCAFDNSYINSFEGELKQVFMSIINNSVDALLEKDIQNPKISISIKDEQDNLIVTIADNADGIPLEIIEKIFLPYFSTKNKKNGTGLGLHMAKTIIEQHVNGSITVQNSERLGGAEFTITVPQAQKKG